MADLYRAGHFIGGVNANLEIPQGSGVEAGQIQRSQFYAYPVLVRGDEAGVRDPPVPAPVAVGNAAFRVRRRIAEPESGVGPDAVIAAQGDVRSTDIKGKIQGRSVPRMLVQILGKGQGHIPPGRFLAVFYQIPVGKGQYSAGGTQVVAAFIGVVLIQPCLPHRRGNGLRGDLQLRLLQTGCQRGRVAGRRGDAAGQRRNAAVRLLQAGVHLRFGVVLGKICFSAAGDPLRAVPAFQQIGCDGGIQPERIRRGSLGRLVRDMPVLPVSDQGFQIVAQLLPVLPVGLGAGHRGHDGAVGELQLRPAHPFCQTVHAFLIRLAVHQEPQEPVAANIDGVQRSHGCLPGEQGVHVQIGGDEGTDNGGITEDILHVQLFRRDAALNDLLAAVNRSVLNVVVADLLERAGDAAVLVHRNGVKASVRSLDHQLANSQADQIGFRYSELGDIQLARSALGDNSGIRGQIFDTRPVDIRRPDAGTGHGGNGCGKCLDGGPFNVGAGNVGRGQLSAADLCNGSGKRINFRPVHMGVDDIGGGDLGAGDGGDGSVQLVRGNAARRQLPDPGGHRRQGVHVQGFDQGFGDMGLRNGRRLDMSGTDGGVFDFQGTNGTVDQLSRPDGIQGQLGAGDGAGGQLPGGDSHALQGIRRRAQGHGGILLQQTVVGILGHAHGNLHRQPGNDDPHAVAQIDFR